MLIFEFSFYNIRILDKMINKKLKNRYPIIILSDDHSMKISFYLFNFYNENLIKLGKTRALFAINFIILTKYFCLL